MGETSKPSFSTKPIKWLFFIYLLMWSPMLCVYLMRHHISDSIPFLKVGLVESLTLFLGVFSIILLFYFLCLCLQWKLRLLALVCWTGILFGGVSWLFSNYRIDFSGDMWPNRFVKIVTTREVKIESDLGKVVWEEDLPGSFPKFLGPTGDTRVDWIEIDDQAKDSDFKVLWKKEIGEGWSGVCAVGGIAFTMEQNGKFELTTARKIDTGEIVWIHKDLHRHADPAGGVGPRSTPTFHQGKLYTLGAVGTLNCLNPENGKVIWSVELFHEYGIKQKVKNEGKDNQYDAELSGLSWGRSASPLIVDDKVIVPVGKSENGTLTTMAAFDKTTGEKVWEGGKRQISYGTPVLASLGGTNQILLTTEEHVVGHDPATGKELWSYSRPGSSAGEANTSQPIVYDHDKVLMTKEYRLGGELVQIKKIESKPAKDSGSSEDAVQDETWKPSSVWKNKKALQTKLTVAVVEGKHAYCISAGLLECTDLETGERVWRSGRYGHGQLLKIGEFFLVMSEWGKLHLVEANPDGADVLVKTKKLLDGRCWNTLCVFKDKLLARSEYEIICVQLPVVSNNEPKDANN